MMKTLKRFPGFILISIFSLAITIGFHSYCASSWAQEDVDYGLDVDEQQGGGGLMGETIRILNGNVIESRSDIYFPSPNSLGLSFNAYYNSRSDTLDTFGYGWTHTYSVSLDPDFDINGSIYIRIEGETGRAHYFTEAGPGSYNGAFHERSHVELEGMEYVWYRLDGTTYGFFSSGDLQGKLSWIEGEKGNRLDLYYAAQNRLDMVLDNASNRSLAFYYNNGLLESIMGPFTDAVVNGIWVNYDYDTNQNLTSVIYADGSGFNYDYTDSYDIHNLTEKRDKSNHLLNDWSYDVQDRAISNFSVNGKGINNINYDEYYNYVDVTDAYGVTRAYSLTEIGDRKRVNYTCPPPLLYNNNTTMNWYYDDSMRLIEVVYYPWVSNHYQNYDERGNPGTIILAVGTDEERTIHYTYHPEMNVPLTRTELTADIMGMGDKVTIWDYDVEADPSPIPNEAPTRLLSRIIEQGFTSDPNGGSVPYEYITNFTYNQKGQVFSIDDPRWSMPTTITYDDFTGDLWSITRPHIGTTYFTVYDQAGRPREVSDVNNQSKIFDYDGKGRVITIHNFADGSSTMFNYNLDGKLDSVTDEDNITRSFTYDLQYGRLTRITDMEGNYIKYDYDAQGNRIEMGKYDSGDNRTERKRWDYQHPFIPGRLWKEINADDTYTEYDYDSGGRLYYVTDPENNSTFYDYDPLNRLWYVEQPGYATTEYEYDNHGNLISVNDAEDNITTYGYDDMGRVVYTGSPDAGFRTYAYDEAGNLIQKTDAKDITVSYVYDDLNRLTGVLFPDATQDIMYSYDLGANGIGRLAEIINPSGNLSFGYDARGRLTTRISTIEGQGYAFGKTFTPGGRVDTVTYPSGRTFDYTRDDMGRMRDLATTYNSNTVMLAQGMTYNPFGGPKGMETGAGGEVENQTGECDCIEVVNPGSMMERVYSYNNNRNLLSVNAPNMPWYNQVFGYDELNRLISAEGRYGSLSYTYDNVGNRLTRTHNGEIGNYNYIPDTNKLNDITGVNPVSFTHDANGNITGIGAKTLIYNQNNRLIRVEESGTPLGEYAYNALGQRVKKDVSGNITIFHYDTNGKLIAEGTPDGTITKEYLYMGKIRMAMVDVASQSFYYFLNDRLGTPQLMTDDTGTVVWEAIYKPFGEALIHPQATVVNNFRFPGQYYDQEAGLHYNYFRYYDPRTGRYLRADPIGLIGGLNLFAYVGNNPTNIIDPMGLAEGDWWDPRTYIEISISATVMGEGTTTPIGGNEQKTISPLTLFGGSIDIYIGVIPTYRDTVYAHGLGIGKHLGVGHFYARPDLRGNFQAQGLVLHFGMGLGSPIFFSETLPDRNRPFSNLMDKELYFTNPCEE